MNTTENSLEQVIEKSKKIKINENRRARIENLAKHLLKLSMQNENLHICYSSEKNSSRSQLCQFWSQYIANDYFFENLHFHSFGIKTSFVKQEMIEHLEDIGFIVNLEKISHKNPIYKVSIDNKRAVRLYSKDYNDTSIPEKFVTIETSKNNLIKTLPKNSEILKFSLIYPSPSRFNKKNIQKEYTSFSMEIIAEINYLFQYISNLIS